MKLKALAESVLARELRVACLNERVSVQVHITREPLKQQLEAKVASERDAGPLGKEMVQDYRRPHLGEVVMEATESAVGRLAVLVCGPAKMADDVRAAVVVELKKGHGHVELFHEGFAW